MTERISDEKIKGVLCLANPLLIDKDLPPYIATAREILEENENKCADTIFCLKQESCEKCPFYNETLREKR